MPVKVSRPVLRWHGGKWRLAPWIISQFPPHKFYTEVFGGAASVLLRKPRAYAEVYNDLDGEIVNLFRVLQSDRNSEKLIRQLNMTPFARREFERSYRPTPHSVERARRLVVRSFMGFGSNAHTIGNRTGFRSFSNRSHTTPAHDWANYPEQLKVIIERLRGVVIENRPAIEVLGQHDHVEALHYLDPPYLMSVRTDRSRDYNHEMNDDDHRELAAFVKTLKGMVIISGYPSPLYEELYHGWLRREKAAIADGAKPRTEVLWISPNAERARHSLFERSACSPAA